MMLGTRLGIVSGIATHLEQVLQSDLKNKYQFIHFQVGGQGGEETLIHRVKRYLFSPISLAIRIIREKPDLVHINTSFDYKAFWRDAVYLMVSRSLRKKTIYQVHGGKLPDELFGKSVVLNAFLKKFLQLPEAVVVLSEYEQSVYYRFARISNFKVIPNAIDLVPYQGALGKEFKTPVLILAYLGALTLDKGLGEILEALNKLNKNKKNVKFEFLIAGSGDYETILRRQTEELGLQEKVKFLGPLFGEEKVQFWLKAHIFVFPTYREGLPYSLLESLASGTPVITTRVGAIPEVITDQVHGYFIDHRDISQLTGIIEMLMSQRYRLQAMSLNCIVRAREYYGIERLTEQLSRLYDFLLGPNPAGSSSR